ncbi:MarR family winged helix-turn-helix transcriptional regulator [Mycobacterium yunnanensis]|uniref:MarR family winged helix-turn-helix transcriptional regulator n=1 Tax=Mycobacterium yunnanensis TaxID=368477 RepID=UPI0021F3B4A9|nr:MarR family transcriptional regulator [Mycobacterium yunnanensis]
MPTTTSLDSVSEVLFRVGRWWTEALSTGLLDAEVNGIEGWRVLGALRDGNGLPMSDIATAMSVAPPTLTRIVDKLVDGGLVVRRVDATDRRRVLVYLSAKGKTKVRKLLRQEASLRSALVDEFGEDTAAALLATLARLSELPVPGR